MFLHLLHQMPCVCTFSVSLWSKAMVKRTLEALLIPIATGIIKIFRNKIIYSYSSYFFYLFVSFKGKKKVFHAQPYLQMFSLSIMVFGFLYSEKGKREKASILSICGILNTKFLASSDLRNVSMMFFIIVAESSLKNRLHQSHAD